MTILDSIKQDHDRYKEQMEQLNKAKSIGQSEKDLFQRFASDIDAHTKAEQQTLYPALEQHDKAKQHVLQAYEEHHVATMVLDELKSMEQTDERWMAKMQVLSELVKHHIEEEEETIFEESRDILKKERLDQLGEEWEPTKQRQMREVQMGGKSGAAKTKSSSRR